MTVFHRLNVAAIERETPDAVAITLRVPDELKSAYRYTPAST
ncbi:phenylacetate-CoA oxygenase/reductase, PaaK subunit [Serratia rubidaea]|uniref:Phenylacetate-CoA oxygenase/reductase, PaaK subunit n=1 Tax=Serratia rubidaea TaxID=61652 RepID=A0A4U9HK73_SERRU|nr:phenylacetate-CoA oxygenase/reductase, PaaK subunit [Serratia rubidaea]